MKSIQLLIFVLAGAVAASAQTPAKPALHTAAKAKPATAAAKPAASAAADKLPAGIPAVTGPKQVAFSLRYQDIKAGTGADATSNKWYKVKYTGWFASNGNKFDASDDHATPVVDADGKPVMDADGKPKLEKGQPIGFPQGFGRVIAGWDQGFNGMKIGGKRRLFIPWQLAYGAVGRPGPDAAHPGIPPRADLIFDVELVDITDLPMPPGHAPVAQGVPAHPAAGNSANGTASSPGMPVQGTAAAQPKAQ